MIIYKYELTFNDFNDIGIPEGGTILTIRMQRGLICLWALVEPDRPLVYRTFEIVGTGKPLGGVVGVFRKYLGTVEAGPYIWHAFEHVLSEDFSGA